VLPKPHNWLQGGFAAGGNGGRLLRKLQKARMARDKMKGT